MNSLLDIVTFQNHQVMRKNDPEKVLTSQNRKFLFKKILLNFAKLGDSEVKSSANFGKGFKEKKIKLI